jgi:hypothetical protein
VIVLPFPAFLVCSAYLTHRNRGLTETLVLLHHVARRIRRKAYATTEADRWRKRRANVITCEPKRGHATFTPVKLADLVKHHRHRSNEDQSAKQPSPRRAPTVTLRMISQFARSPGPAQRDRLLAMLTPREGEVLELVGHGLSDTEIAARVLFQLAEEIGFTGSPAPLAGPVQPVEAHLVRDAAVGGVACAPPLRRRKLGMEALISAPVVLAIGFVSLFFARALFVWFYNRTGYSVLLVAIFHASFDGAISQLSDDVVPRSNTARFLIFSGVIVVFATSVIIATKGKGAIVAWIVVGYTAIRSKRSAEIHRFP